MAMDEWIIGLMDAWRWIHETQKVKCPETERITPYGLSRIQTSILDTIFSFVGNRQKKRYE
jgi:hypothetical protein